MIRITSKENSLIKSISKLNKNSKYRKEQGMFIAEGVRLCEDAMISSANIVSLIVTESSIKKYSEIITKLSSYAENSYIVNDSLFNVLSNTKTPQGVLCVIKTLDKPTLFDKIKDNGKFLALDNIQDPSNLGTILRTADAVGIDGIVLSDDCCDIYSPKVVRGSMGAVFRLPYLIVGSIADFLLEHNELTSYGAVVNNSAAKITDIEFKYSCIVAVGNEGNGLKTDTIEACNNLITIPMKGRAESLNAAVASSIIMWEMVK